MGKIGKLFLLVLSGVVLLSMTAQAQCPRSGIAAPELAGKDLTGKDLNLADYQGKWVFIDFWASWCAPCMRKLPSVVELHNELKDRSDFAVVSVSLDDKRTKGDLDDVYDRYGITFPVVYDGGGFNSSLADKWCVDAIPSTFLIDPNGQIYAADVSPEEAQRLIEASTPQQQQAATPPRQPAEEFQPSTPAGTFTTPAVSTTSREVQPAPADFTYRMQLLDHAPSFGGQGLHQVTLSLPASALDGATTSFKVNATWDDYNGSSHHQEYRLALKADPANPLTPQDLSITGDMQFFIDQAAGSYMLEIAVPSSYTALKVSLSRYDAVAGTYLPGTLQR